jgi:hypothetical protein
MTDKQCLPLRGKGDHFEEMVDEVFVRKVSKLNNLKNIVFLHLIRHP